TGQDVYLKDNNTGAETDLKAEAYTFTTAAGVDNTRFSLKYQKTLKVDAPAFNENSVRVYKNNGTLYVNSGKIAINSIQVYDIQGRLIAEQKNVKATTTVINNLKATHQVLIVKITSEDNSLVTKKVVN
uniref:T9SS sorting signal type C domain-containing protein n=1 Tax=Flavobacterium sp. TaxID=239 RepID=UPI0037BE2121